MREEPGQGQLDTAGVAIGNAGAAAANDSPSNDSPAGDAPTDDRPSGELSDTVFEAIIAPHQSLNRRGLLTLGILLVSITAFVAIRFALIGAWPVMAFSFVELGLAALLMVLHRRQARRREIIRLNPAEITVVRTDPYGRRRSFSLPSAWLQVRLENALNGGRTRLWLRSHGRGWEVGAFLHDPERQSLFEALKDAVHRVRHPTFHNDHVLER
jgi:uncharacterized membrane protein